MTSPAENKSVQLRFIGKVTTMGKKQRVILIPTNLHKKVERFTKEKNAHRITVLIEEIL